MRKPKPSTIYVSGETVERARMIEQATGIKASRLFQDFVTRYARSLQDGQARSVDSLAFLLPGMVPWELYSPRPFFDQDQQAPGADIWVDAFREGQSPAYKVFLMGKTLANPLTNHEDMWVDFLSRGGTLQVLLQGDISGGAEEYPRLWATANKARCYEKARVRGRVIETLTRIIHTVESPNLEVRNSGEILLNTNASLIFREDGTLDIYISFAVAESSGSRSVVILTTASHNPPDETCELVARPYEKLWLASVPEPGFEEANGSGRSGAVSRRSGRVRPRSATG